MKLVGKMREKKKNRKTKNIGHTSIRTTVGQAVGLYESILDHSASICCILHYSNIPIDP